MVEYIYIYSCEPTTLSIHQSVLSFGLCISVCLIIHPIILYTYYLPIYLSILLPLRPSIYLSNSFQLIVSSWKKWCFSVGMLVQFRGISLACIPGGTMDVAPYSCKRGGITSTVFGIEVGKFFGNLPASTKREGCTTTEIFGWRQLVWPKKHIFDASLGIHVSDIDSFWFFEKIDLHTACLRYLSICISSVSQSANKTSPNKDFQQIMESYSYMCHPKLVLTALRTSSNKTTPGLCQRKSFPTANRLIQYHCLFAWFGPSNFGVVYIEAQICRGLNHIKRRFTNFATFDLSAMRGTEKCVTLWVLAKGVRSEEKESTYPSCSTSRGHKEGPNNNHNNK